MPIVNTDIQQRLSGGGANADPNASLGGAMSSVSIVDATLNDLWDDTTGPEAFSGDIEYRCIYVLNNHGTLTYLGAKIWILALTTSADDEVDIGLGTTAVGTGNEQVIANESTAPTGVTFSRPTSSGTALVIGDIPPGSRKAVWIRRTVNAGAAASTGNQYQLSVSGETLA